MEGLPVEIIQTVFLELCPPAIFPLSRFEPRLLVTQVCPRWREIALSTPALWADYYIHFHFPHSHLQPGRIRAWISRAAQSPLSFTICGPALKTFPMISDVVLPVIHRCSLLSFSLSTATLNHLLTLPPESLPMLRSIEFGIEDETRYTPMAGPTPFATVFKSCPQLRTFKLITGRCRENSRIANFNAPWHQLTTLHLYSSSIPAHECLNILRRCTSLQECGIHVSPVDNHALRRIIKCSRRPIILPFLHTLDIKFLDLGSNNCDFFHAFRLPRLRKFQPRGPNYLGYWPLSKFQSVLCETIKELDLSGFKFPRNLPETLALVPNLEILWLGDGSHMYPKILSALREGALSPRLMTLRFSTVESLDFLFDALEARVKAARADPSIAAFTKIAEPDQGHQPFRRSPPSGIGGSWGANSVGLAQIGVWQLMPYRPP